MTRASLAFGFSVAAFAILVGPALAGDPLDDIKYRQATMAALGGHMSAVASVVQGKVNHKAHLAGHVSGLVATAAMVSDVFPEGSDMGETDALPAIWQKPADFRKAVEALRAAVPKLDAAVKTGDDAGLKAAFGEVGKACKGCHDDFRKKKQ